MKTLSYKQLGLSPDQEWELGAFGAENVSVLGNTEILNADKLGLLCSVRCPAKLVLRAHDYMRSKGKKITVVSGFHSPVEQECLKILVQSDATIVMCPARSIRDFDVPSSLQESLRKRKLLILSIFQKSYKRVDARIAYQRNKFVAILANSMLIPFADKQSKTLELVRYMIAKGKTVWAFDAPENSHLFQLGVKRI